MNYCQLLCRVFVIGTEKNEREDLVSVLLTSTFTFFMLMYMERKIFYKF